jgi:Xaa-Pro aminopeptidase
VNYSVSNAFNCKKITISNDITAELKTCKNEVEIKNLKIANEKDALAFTKLMKWLQTYSVGQDIDENDVRDRLVNIREGIDGYLNLSFEPISAYGPSAALPHYHAGNTPRKVERKGFLKVDSGAHFIEGTTDITRTYVMGELTEEMKIHYTAVLKGHIALATAKFPKGTKGFQLDAFARRPLWDLGLNYGHGTGHGIGHLLNVHEGPLNISPKLIDVPLEIGMLISNEPGYYKENEYGIRLENTILVVPDESSSNGEFLKFETVSFVPFDLTAINASMLNQQEKDWLNDYHRVTYEKISTHLCENGKAWLRTVTAEI